MGWNSWDSWWANVTEEIVKKNADYVAAKLMHYGWEYVVVDIRWFVRNQTRGGYNTTNPDYVLDEWGRYFPAENKFPSAVGEAGFKPLADYIHGLGLKFGIHIMRGIPVEAVNRKLPVKGADGITADMIYSADQQCAWLKDNYTITADRPGAQEYYDSIFDLYASWGVDYIKVDDISRPYHKPEIELIRNAIGKTGRKIVLSLSPGETPVAEGEHVRLHANMWRMVDDFWDNWDHFIHELEVCGKWAPYTGPGHWPDADMLPFGRLSISSEDPSDGPRYCRLSHDEQYSVMTLFSILRSPLMFGGNLPDNDDFTLSLLINGEVLDMHQKSENNRELFRNENEVTAWTADDAASGDKYLALFYTGGTAGSARTVTFDMDRLGLIGAVKVRDLWRRQDIGSFSGNEFAPVINSHGTGLFRLSQ